MRHTKPGRTAVAQLSAVIYCRVSKADIREKRSVGQQETESRKVADQEEWSVSDDAVFAEKPTSASRFSTKARPQYLAMMEYLKNERPNVLILWEVSRSDRKLGRGVDLLDLCRELEILVHVVSLQETFDPTKQRDRETLVREYMAAEAESERTSIRTKRDMADSAEQGRPHGKILYGYSREYDGHKRFIRQVIVEDQAEIIREAAKRVAEGETPYAVVKDFNARGIPAPRSATWDISKIRELVTKPAYIGKRVHIPSADRLKGIKTGTLVDAVWPAILDEGTWQTCVDKFADPTRKTHRDTSIKHLLSGIATCGAIIDGEPCNSVVRPQNNNGIPSYLCSAGWHVSVSRTELDDYVNQEVRKRLNSVTPVDDEDQGAQREAAKSEIADLQSQLDEAREQYLRPAPGTKRLSAVMLAQIESDLEPQIQALQSQIRATRVLPIVGKLISNPEKWDDMSLPEKREFLRSGTILDGIDVMPTGRGVKKPIEERVEIHWVETRLSRNPNS